MIDYQIQMIDGIKTKEAVTENSDGSYTIFVNSRLNDVQQRQAVDHAMRHILGNDFENIGDVQNIERKAHRIES